MVYVYYFASFIVLLREVLRPGVLWFLRNLNDPDFSPIQVSRLLNFVLESAPPNHPQFLFFSLLLGNDSLVHITSHATSHRFCYNLWFSCYVNAVVAYPNFENTLANFLAIHLVG